MRQFLGFKHRMGLVLILCIVIYCVASAIYWSDLKNKSRSNQSRAKEIATELNRGQFQISDLDKFLDYKIEDCPKLPIFWWQSRLFSSLERELGKCTSGSEKLTKIKQGVMLTKSYLVVDARLADALKGLSDQLNSVSGEDFIARQKIWADFSDKIKDIEDLSILSKNISDGYRGLNDAKNSKNSREFDKNKQNIEEKTNQLKNYSFDKSEIMKFSKEVVNLESEG